MTIFWAGAPRFLYGRAMLERRPPGRHFEHAELEIVWAAIRTLDTSLKYVLLRELATDLSAEKADPRNPRQTIRSALVALCDAAELLGHSPTLSEYRQLRAANPELDLMSDGKLRRALGNASWNACLTRALLDTTSDGDFVTRSAGGPFTEDELIAAVGEYMDEHGSGVPPTGWELLGWAKHPRVQARPGRRPQSFRPFSRFGGYRAVIKRAGFCDEGRTDKSGRRIPLDYRFSDEELVRCLRAVAERLGRVPREADYRDEQARIIEESRDQGVQPPPAASTLTRRWGPWPNVLEAAGLPPVGDTRRPRGPIARRPTYSLEEKLDWLRAAWVAVGVPFTVDSYDNWRRDELESARRAGKHLAIPSVDTIVRTLGGWPAAVRMALPNVAKDRKRDA